MQPPPLKDNQQEIPIPNFVQVFEIIKNNRKIVASNDQTIRRNVQNLEHFKLRDIDERRGGFKP